MCTLFAECVCVIFEKRIKTGKNYKNIKFVNKPLFKPLK